MIQLTEWYLDKAWAGEIFARGYVTGHHRLADGEWIHTSRIESMETVEGDKLIMHTHSGSVYQLDINEIASMEAATASSKFLAELGISEAVCASVTALADKKEARMIALAEQALSAQELYLFVRGNSTLKAYWKEAQGKVRTVITGYHSGMFQDSVLVTDFESGQVDFRYFPGWGAIQPYHWNDGLEAVWIHNVAKQEIEFVGTTERISCPGKQRVRIPKSAYNGEGLMSPDVVNGKSMLSDILKNVEEE